MALGVAGNRSLSARVTLKRLLVAPEVLQDVTAVAKCIRVVRLDGERPVIAIQRLGLTV